MIYKPEIGEPYWAIVCRGIQQAVWTGDYVDEWRRETGNIYRTAEEASLSNDRRVLLTKMREAAEAAGEGYGKGFCITGRPNKKIWGVWPINFDAPVAPGEDMPIWPTEASAEAWLTVPENRAELDRLWEGD